MDYFGTGKAGKQGDILMATLRDIEHLRRQVTIRQAIDKAADSLDKRTRERRTSVPDDKGAGGYYEDDDDNVLTFNGWLMAGDAAGSKYVRPY